MLPLQQGVLSKDSIGDPLSRLPTGVFFRRMPLVGKRPMFSFAPEHWWGKPLVLQRWVRTPIARKWLVSQGF